MDFSAILISYIQADIKHPDSFEDGMGNGLHEELHLTM